MMKLFYAGPSPYARKTIVVAHERQLRDKIQFIPVNPWENPRDFLAASPVGKVPALAADDGRLIVESMCIARYFNAIGSGTDLLGPDVTDVMAREGLAHGLMDAAFGLVIEKRRPEERQWSDWLDRQRNAIERLIPVVEAKPGRFDLGDITLACALSYLDFRLPEVKWREKRADLGTWMNAVSGRPSMAQSSP